MLFLRYTNTDTHFLLFATNIPADLKSMNNTGLGFILMWQKISCLK
jgi:hypothetical protein